MSKKIFIIISIVLLLAVAGLAWYYFFVLPAQNQTGSATANPKTFSPFGDTGNSGTTIGFSSTTPDQNQTNNANQLNYTKKLRELWNQPTAGAGISDSKAGSTVRFVDKATGFVYEVQLFSPAQNRLSNTTIPLAYNALWDAQNSSFVAQYLKDDNTVSTNVLSLKSGTSTDQTLSGFSLGSKISSVSVFGENIFYLQKYTGLSQGFVSTFDGKKIKQVWQSPLDELYSQMVNANAVALTTKPYQNVLGFTYLVNTTTGSVKKLVGGVYGLTSLVSPDASKVLYSSQSDSGSFMFLDDIKGNTIQNITPATFPEKCAWSKKNAMVVYCAVPEDSLGGASLTGWYMGQISFTDDIWKYDLKQNTASIIEHLSDDAGERVDVIKPILSDSEQYLIFTNKIDGTLWSLDLSK